MVIPMSNNRVFIGVPSSQGHLEGSSEHEAQVGMAPWASYLTLHPGATGSTERVRGRVSQAIDLRSAGCLCISA